MKKIIFLIILCLLSNSAFAECDFATGVSKTPSGTYEYTKECHIFVGKTIQDNDTKTQQVEKLNKALDLKDLALEKSDQRAQLWRDTSFKLEDDVQKMNSYRNTNQWINFGLGILVTGAAVWGAGQLR